VDKSITYERRPFSFSVDEVSVPNGILCPLSDPGKKYFKWLAFCGIIYLMISYDSINYHIMTPLELEKQFGKSDDSKYKWATRYFRSLRSNSEINGKPNSTILGVSKNLNAPVFTFSSYHGWNFVRVDELIPVLGNIGFAALMTPEQAYQEISHFLCNTIKPSPDEMPAVSMTDKERISSHGFDLKQSFRHRK